MSQAQPFTILIPELRDLDFLVEILSGYAQAALGLYPASDPIYFSVNGSRPFPVYVTTLQKLIASAELVSA